MANEAEQAIYQRLLQAAAYHPGSAELFADDWALEPGDVVTVQSASEDYSLPIFNMKLDWTGQSMVNVEATGNKERAPLPELKRKRYSGGRAAHEETKELGIHVDTEIARQDGMIGLVVELKDGDYVIKSAEITAAINRTTGESIATIKADHIIMQGNMSVENAITAANAAFTNLTTGVTAATALGTATFSVTGSATIHKLFLGTPQSSADYEFKVEGQNVTWKSKTVVTKVGVTMPTISVGGTHTFLYSQGAGQMTPSGTASGKLVTQYSAGSVSPTTDVIYYLGRTPSS